jgi:hypothetical protein
MRNLKLKTLPLLLLLLMSAGATSIYSASLKPSAGPQRKRDKVIATRSATGTLKGFEVGDYQHAVINLANGEEKSFFIGEVGLPYFLALNKNATLTLTYQVVDSYIEEAGGVQRIERLSGARAGKQTYAAWWRKMRAKHSLAQLEKMYEGMVEKLRLNP